MRHSYSPVMRYFREHIPNRLTSLSPARSERQSSCLCKTTARKTRQYLHGELGPAGGPCNLKSIPRYVVGWDPTRTAKVVRMLVRCNVCMHSCPHGGRLLADVCPSPVPSLQVGPRTTSPAGHLRFHMHSTSHSRPPSSKHSMPLTSRDGGRACIQRNMSLGMHSARWIIVGPSRNLCQISYWEIEDASGWSGRTQPYSPRHMILE